MNVVIKVDKVEDILPEYRDTPIGRMIEFHNLERPFETYTQAQILVGMCMDNRKSLRLPENFAYIIRAGGANLRYSEFKVSYAIAVGNVKHIAVIGHTHCAMVNLISRKDLFINGLVDNAGWSRERADEHFMNYAPMFEIENEVNFVVSEAIRLRSRYPLIKVAPLLYKVEDNRLYMIQEN